MAIASAGTQETGTDVVVIDELRSLISAFRGVERQIGEHFALHTTDTAALEVIARLGGATPSQLVQQLGVSSSAVTFVIDRLVAAGHITREPNPADRRSTLLRPVVGTVSEVRSIMQPIGMRLQAAFDELTPAGACEVVGFLRAARDAMRLSPIPRSETSRGEPDSSQE